MHECSPALMHHSRPFRSSLHCKASPDGQLVAVLESSAVLVRSSKSLQMVHAVRLSPDLTGAVNTLIWSPSSTRLLISTGNEIQVSSARDSSFHAMILNPVVAEGGRPPLIRFGATDVEVLVCSRFGTKLSVFDLSESKAVEISNPKSSHPASSASWAFAVRPKTGHLVVLTRTGGRDVVSIHHPSTRQLARSWHPDSHDAQCVQWTPDGHWILLWESPAHGKRLLVYTAEGQPFRILDASDLATGSVSDKEASMELGIKSCQLSCNAELCALGDSTRAVTIIRAGAWRPVLTLRHPTVIIPLDNLQVWQEHADGAAGAAGAAGTSSNGSTFVKAGKPVSPAVVAGSTAQSGCSVASFDASSTLLATRLDDSPCTIWIWDVAAGELRAALMFHSPVSFVWHPSSRELLLIFCLDEPKFYLWDPLSRGPSTVHADEYLPASKASHNKLQLAWLDHGSELPELMVSDARHCALLLIADARHEANPWEATSTTAGLSDDDDEDEADGGSWPRRHEAASTGSAGHIVITEDISKLDDTFSFRYA